MSGRGKNTTRWDEGWLLIKKAQREKNYRNCFVVGSLVEACVRTPNTTATKTFQLQSEKGGGKGSANARCGWPFHTSRIEIQHNVEPYNMIVLFRYSRPSMMHIHGCQVTAA